MDGFIGNVGGWALMGLITISELHGLYLARQNGFFLFSMDE